MDLRSVEHVTDTDNRHICPSLIELLPLDRDLRRMQIRSPSISRCMALLVSFDLRHLAGGVSVVYPLATLQTKRSRPSEPLP